jgi:hypothetical protein
MPALVAMVGAFVGFSIGGASGALQGGLFGYLLMSVLEQSSRIRDLERSLSGFSPKASEVPPPPSVEPVRDTPLPQAPQPRATLLPPPSFAAPVEREPDIFERVWSWAKPYFTGPSLIVTVGVVVLFFGVAFIEIRGRARSPADEPRPSAAALGDRASAWLARDRASGFGLALQGAASESSTHRLRGFPPYTLVPGTAAFGLLVLFVTLSAVLAIAQDSLALATLATVGGFLAPVLTSTGQGSHVALFSYYAVLNAGILATAWFRSYRLLNLLGFLSRSSSR